MSSALKSVERKWEESQRESLTPAQAQETLPDYSVSKASHNSHVGLPCLCEHPAEGGQEEEVKKGSNQCADHLRDEARALRKGELEVQLPALTQE